MERIHEWVKKMVGRQMGKPTNVATFAKRDRKAIGGII